MGSNFYPVRPAETSAGESNVALANIVASKPRRTVFTSAGHFGHYFSLKYAGAAQPQSPWGQKMGERDCRGEGLPPACPGREPLLLRNDSNASKEAEFWDHVANQNSLG